MLSERELATVLAALRFWQHSQGDAAVDDLILNGPQFRALRPLLPIEIDALCERLSEPCGCEAPGPYCCGLSGILARIIDCRIDPASVARCDDCARFPSDEAAQQFLADLGYIPSPGS